eukprot:1953512-Prymnesium_polylepis.1
MSEVLAHEDHVAVRRHAGTERHALAARDGSPDQVLHLESVALLLRSFVRHPSSSPSRSDATRAADGCVGDESGTPAARSRMRAESGSRRTMMRRISSAACWPSVLA